MNSFTESVDASAPAKAITHSSFQLVKKTLIRNYDPTMSVKKRSGRNERRVKKEPRDSATLVAMVI
jgi:hypothetical protein